MGPRGRPCALVLIKILLIASERNSTQVRLGKIRALLQGVPRPQETGQDHHQDFCLSVSVCQHYLLLLQTDFYLAGNVIVTVLGSHLPCFVFL